MAGLVSALALAKKGFQDIHIFEAASDLGFVGAGIQLAPNLARILDRLGCWESVEAEANEVLETSIRGERPKFKDDRPLSELLASRCTHPTCFLTILIVD